MAEDLDELFDSISMLLSPVEKQKNRVLKIYFIVILMAIPVKVPVVLVLLTSFKSMHKFQT